MGGITTLPLINVPVGTYSYVDVVDASTTINMADVTDMTRNRREAYGFAVEVCITNAFVSDYSRVSPLGKLSSPIMEFAVMKLSENYKVWDINDPFSYWLEQKTYAGIMQAGI